jgi:hypothetical protein
MAQFPVQDDLNYGTNYAIKGGAPGNAFFYAAAIVMAHRIPWWKVSPGDCGQATAVPLGASIQAEKLGGGIASTLNKISGSLGLAGTIAGLALLPLTLLSEAHAHAVAQETEVGCQAAVAWNTYAATIENGLQNGTIALSDALQSLDPAASQVDGMLAQIQKTPGDAAAMMRQGIRGLVLLYKQPVGPDGKPHSLAWYAAQATLLQTATPTIAKSGGIALAAVAGGLLLWRIIAGR